MAEFKKPIILAREGEDTQAHDLPVVNQEVIGAQYLAVADQTNKIKRQDVLNKPDDKELYVHSRKESEYEGSTMLEPSFIVNMKYHYTGQDRQFANKMAVAPADYEETSVEGMNYRTPVYLGYLGPEEKVNIKEFMDNAPFGNMELVQGDPREGQYINFTGGITRTLKRMDGVKLWDGSVIYAWDFYKWVLVNPGVFLTDASTGEPFFYEARAEDSAFNVKQGAGQDSTHIHLDGVNDFTNRKIIRLIRRSLFFSTAEAQVLFIEIVD